MVNLINARVQHAVIGEGSTNTSSEPKKGEIIFNEDCTNFKVGDESNEYSELPYILPLNTIYREMASSDSSTIPEIDINDSISNNYYSNNNIILYDGINKWLHKNSADYPNYPVGYETILLAENAPTYEWLLANTYKNLKFTVIVKKTSSSDILDKFISIVLPYESGGLSTAIEKVLIANKNANSTVSTNVINSGSSRYVIYRKALTWSSVGDTTQSVSDIYYGSADFSIMCVDNITPKFVIS